MSTPTCVRCGRPTPDGYADPGCRDRAAAQLAEIVELLPAARDVAYGLARRGTGGGASGKPGSRLPINLAAAAKLDAVQNALTTWARMIAEERGAAAVINAEASWGADAGSGRGETGRDDLRASAVWLGEHLEWMRHRAEVDEFLTDVEAAARVIRSVAEPPADHRAIVGMCDCGKTLYALQGRQVVTCPDCEQTWGVDDSREGLRDHLDERLVTAAEAAHLSAFLDTDRSQQQIRKLVNKWAERDELSVDDTGEEPRYWFGNIAFRLSQAPKRVLISIE